MPLVILLLFIIAAAVAPEAIINICRFIEWCFKALFYTIATIATVWFFGYAILSTYHRLFA